MKPAHNATPRVSGRLDLRIDPDTYERLEVPLERLFRAYDEPLRRFLRACFGEADGDDAVARTWVITARHVDRVEFARGLDWLRTVGYHEGLAIRKENRLVLVDGEVLEYLAGGRDGLADEVAARLDAIAEAEAVFAELIPNQRRALVARSLGLSYRQIAQATGTSLTHVNRHLTEGRARARKGAR